MMYDSEQAVQRYEAGDTWNDDDEVVEVEVKQPLDKVIPIRLPGAKWEAIRREAQELGIGPTTLARMWLLERLRNVPAVQGKGSSSSLTPKPRSSGQRTQDRSISSRGSADRGGRSDSVASDVTSQLLRPAAKRGRKPK